MASSIPKIIAPPDVGQATSAQGPPGGVLASKPDKASSNAAATSAQAICADNSSSSPAQVTSADLRLEIDDDKAAGCFVYKIINRTTGEIVEQIPQEQIVKLRESDGYMAGDVIKAQA